MTPIPPPENNPSDPAAPAPVVGAAELAANVQSFWEKNRSFIIGACVAGILAIVAVEAWRLLRESRDRGVREAYAQAGTDVAKLTRFADEHDGHPLAGAALLVIADQKFEAGDFKAAADAYAKAVGAGELGALLGRARVGEAMSKVLGGDRAGGESALQAVKADTSLPKAARAEATYHLASLALESGNKEEAAKLAAEIAQIEPTGMWAQRAAALRINPEAPATPAPATPAADSLFKPGGE